MNQVAVVIGGGQTLGEFLCRGLAAEGYRNGEPDIVGLDGYQLQWLRHAFRI